MVGKKDILTIDTKEVKKLLEKKYFLARAIIEVLGKPKEHVSETLMQLLKQFSEDDRYKLISFTVENPQKVKEMKDMFSAFAEIEFIAKDEIELIYFATDYMPSSIEIIEPAEMKVQASYTSHMLTEFVGRLHAVDMEFKKVKAENDVLKHNLAIMIKNTIIVQLRHGANTVEQLAKLIGVDVPQAQIFLDSLEKEKRVQKKDNTYSLL